MWCTDRRHLHIFHTRAVVQERSFWIWGCECHDRDPLEPKRLDPGQGRMGVAGTLQNGVQAGVLAARQQPRGKGALRIPSAAATPPALISNGRDTIFMNCDVVEIAQTILHAFQSREKLLPTLSSYPRRARQRTPMRIAPSWLECAACDGCGRRGG